MKKFHYIATTARDADYLETIDDEMHEVNWLQKSRALQSRRWKKVMREAS
jgi:hypothetical protein